MSARMPNPSNAVARVEPRAGQTVTPHMEFLRPPRMSQGEVRLSIDRLRIEGLNLTSRQGEQVQGAVERELARLLQAQPLQLRGGAIPGMRAQALSATLGTDPGALGAEIARSLFAAMRDEISGGGR